MAKDAQQASEARYQAIISAFPDLIFRVSRDGIYLDIQAAKQKMLTTAPENYLGRKLHEMLPRDVANCLKRHVQLALDTQTAQVTEYSLDIHGEKSEREARIVACADDEVLLIVRDITERKQTERSLAQYTKRLNISHDLHQGLLSGIPFEEIVADTLQSFCEIVPCQIANLAVFDVEMSQSVLSISVSVDPMYPVSVEHVALSEANWSQNVRGGEQKIIENLADFQEASTIHRKLVAQGIRAYLSTPIVAEKTLIGELGLGVDQPGYFGMGHRVIASQFADQLAASISYIRLRQKVQHHNAELQQHVEERTAELERTRNRVEAILNNSSDGIILTRADGAISQTNWMFDQIFQYQPDELFRHPLTTVVHADSVETVNAALHAVAEEATVRRFEVVARRKDGTVFDAEMGLSLMRVTADDQRGGIVCHVRDITDRKHTEAELIRALKQERELGELKTRFISMASHEFRTPLTTILSSTDILELYIDKMNQDQKGKHFFKIRSSVHHMTQLLDEVLLMGKVESDQIRLNPVSLNLIDLAQQVLEEVQPQAGPDLKFDVALQSEVETVWLDEKLLRHMLTNLLTNAIKYSPNGGTVSFEVSCDLEHVLIRVGDQGIGIPVQDQERLFEPFHRADNVGTIPGTGLGLAITKRAVGLHGGTISFESQVGAGTTFTISIPVQPPEEVEK